jgi:hypothetical protein
VSASISAINAEAREASSSMLRKCRDDRAFIEQSPKITLGKRDELTYAYLLKSLFKSRTYSDPV